MNPLVYLIGTTPKYLKQIEAVIGSDISVLHIQKSQLMMKVFAQMPQAIILVEDDFDEDGFLLVDSTLSFEYIPVICVSFSKEMWAIEHYIEHASYVTSDHMDLLLPALIQQAIHFSKPYHGMHITQDTFDVMNESIHRSMVDYLEADERSAYDVLMSYLQEIYIDNEFIDNCPSVIWLVRKKSGQIFEAYKYPIVCHYDTMEFGLAFEDEDYCFEPYMDTGFYKNKTLEEVSDIAGVEQLVPKKMLEIMDSIDNIANYAMDDIMLIATNYRKPIKQRDLNILKALTVKLDLMMTIKDKVMAIEASFDYTVNALARAAEGKDDVTGHHIKRVNYYSKVIAQALNMSTEFVKNIVIAAQMHDVGKIFIPESVLNKPGKLTDEEFDLMKTHTTQGEVIIGDSEDLAMAANIARYHHERYDGSGYPDGIGGEDIPIEARIVFLADIYDALRSERPYKKGFTHEESMTIILQGDGRVEPRFFDPNVLRVFEDQHLVFNEIFESLRDQ